MQSNIASQFLKRTVAAVCVTAILAGCAASSKDIVGASVSPLLYQNYSCEQLAAESHRVQSKSLELGARLDQASQNDKAITGVALVLFWPAAFALGGNKAQEAEYAKIKGEHEALQQASIARNCSLSTLSAQADKSVAAETKEGVSQAASKESFGGAKQAQ